MNKLETCHHCGEEKENCYHGYLAMCLPIPEAEAQIEKWNLIDAFYTYSQTIVSEDLWMLVAIDWPSTQEEFNNKIKSDSEFSKKWYTKTWWKNLERTDLTEEEIKELDDLTTYDQLLNTVGRGVQCDDCGRKEAELYEKYYPKNLES
jgi:hypothetical protein